MCTTVGCIWEQSKNVTYLFQEESSDENTHAPATAGKDVWSSDTPPEKKKKSAFCAFIIFNIDNICNIWNVHVVSCVVCVTNFNMHCLRDRRAVEQKQQQQ